MQHEISSLASTTFSPGLSLGGHLGEKVSLNWLTSPCFELKEKLKCIECVGKSKIRAKTTSGILLNFAMSESSRLSPAVSLSLL